jgi:hypothetical protein
LDLPERLLRLRVEEWPESGPQPLWWGERGSDTWVVFEARLRWQRARRRLERMLLPREEWTAVASGDTA